MKKIVGILAAAALIATSVFAADVSAKVRIDGDIFAYDGTALDAKDGKPAGSFKLLRASSQARPYWSPYITLSTSTDNAGAQILFIEKDDGKRDIQMDRSNVWFKPLDMLKITAGFQGYNMNVESIDYSPVPTGAEDWGYGISYAQDAISANVFLNTGNNGWFYQDAVAAYNSSEEPLAALIKEVYVNFAYTADFGTISAMFDYASKKWDLTTKKYTLDADTGDIKASDLAKANIKINGFTPDTIKFGAAYKNTIDNLTFFADVVCTSVSAASTKEKDTLVAANKKYTMDKDGNPRSAFGIMVDGFVQYAQDALTLKGYLRMDIDDFGHVTTKDGKKEEDMMADNNFKLGIKLRVDYKLDNGITLFAQFNDENLLRKENKDAAKTEWKDASSVFVSTIKAGANIPVGIATIETALKIETGANVAKCDADPKLAGQYDKVKVSMPIWFQVAF